MTAVSKSYGLIISLLIASATFHALSPAIPQKKLRPGQKKANKPPSRPQQKPATTPPQPAPEPQAPESSKKMTVVLYMLADEHTESYMKFNCSQLEREGVPPDLAMLLFLCTHKSNGVKTVKQIRLQGNKALIVKSGDSQEPDTALLGQALAWASQFTSERYGFIFWDHSTSHNAKNFLNLYYRGRPRILVSPSHRSFLSDVVLDESFKNFTETQIKKPLDFIGFDTGLSTRLDILAAVQPYTHAIIATTQLTSLGGWPYHALLTSFKEGKKTGLSLARALAAKYKEYYDPLTQDYSIAVFDSKTLGEVIANADEITQKLGELLAKQKGRTVTNAIRYSITHTPRVYQQLAYVDMGMWYRRLLEQAHTCTCNDHEDTNLLGTQLRNLLSQGLHLIPQSVLHLKGSKITAPHGPLLYLPHERETDTESHLRSVWSERFHWKDLLTAFLQP